MLLQKLKSMIMLIIGCSILFCSLTSAQTDRYPETSLLRIPLAGQNDTLIIEYLKQGSGKTNVIFLHGFGSSVITWRNTINALSKNFSVYAYNSLGMGKSNNPFKDSASGLDRGMYYGENYLEQLRLFIDHFKIRKPYLVGNSMGCQIALSFAGTYPDLISGFVLIDPSGGSEVSQKFISTGGSIYSMSNSKFDPNNTPTFIKEVLKEVYENDSLITENIMQPYLDQWRSDAGRYAINSSMYDFRVPRPQYGYQILLSAQNTGVKKKINHRGMVIWGREDAWFPSTGVKEYVKFLPGMKSLIVPNAGHLAHEDQPAQVNAALNKFFTSNEGNISFKPLTVRGLIDSLSSSDGITIVKSVYGLQLMKDIRCLIPVIEKLDTKDYFIKTAINKCLIAFGEASVPALCNVIGDTMKSLTERENAVRVLGEFQSLAAAQCLVSAVKCKELRVEAYLSASRAGEQVIPFFIPFLRSPERIEQYYGMRILTSYTRSEILLDTLIQNMQSTQANVRYYSVQVLGEMTIPRALPPLMNALHDQDSLVKERAVFFLGERKSTEAVEPLIQMLNDPSDFITGAVVVALWTIGDKRAVPVLIERLKSAPEKRAKLIAEALSDITKQNFGADYEKWLNWLKNNQ